MITEQELKDKCTTEFIKWMCEYAEGFGYIDYVLSQSSDLEQVRFNNIIFPLLIHRAVEGINKSDNGIVIIITDISVIQHIAYDDEYNAEYEFKNYQSETLTACECAMLDCLIEVLK